MNHDSIAPHVRVLLCVAAAGIVLLGVTTADAQEKTSKAASKSVSAAKAAIGKAPASKGAPPTSTATGMKAYKDPVTGQFREPNSDDFQSPGAFAPTSLAAPVQLLQHPSGAVGVLLTEDQMSFATVHKGPDGKLHFNCTQGKAHAEAHVKAAPRQGGLDVK